MPVLCGNPSAFGYGAIPASTYLASVFVESMIWNILSDDPVDGAVDL